MPDTYGHDVDEGRARATIHAIFDSPVNLLDTSRNCGFGRAEARIGAVIRERGGLPGGFVISTKLDRDMDTNRFDSARARRSFEESLTALGLESVQILQLHDSEHCADMREITQSDGALDEPFRTKEEGLAQAVGLAMGRLDLLIPLLDDWPFDVILNHNRFSLLNRSATPAFELARSREVSVFNAAPYAGGVLAKGSGQVQRITYQAADEARLAPVKRIEAVCERHSAEVGAAALQFSMRDSRVSATIVGVSRPERVEQTLSWANASLGEAVLAELGGLDYKSTDPEAERRYTPG